MHDNIILQSVNDELKLGKTNIGDKAYVASLNHLQETSKDRFTAKNIDNKIIANFAIFKK